MNCEYSELREHCFCLCLLPVHTVAFRVNVLHVSVQYFRLRFPTSILLGTFYFADLVLIYILPFRFLLMIPLSLLFQPRIQWFSGFPLILATFLSFAVLYLSANLRRMPLTGHYHSRPSNSLKVVA